MYSITVLKTSPLAWIAEISAVTHRFVGLFWFLCIVRAQAGHKGGPGGSGLFVVVCATHAAAGDGQGAISRWAGSATLRGGIALCGLLSGTCGGYLCV